MTFEELRLIFIVYTAALLPILILIKNKETTPSWIMHAYLISLFVCIFGWELWFTYGLVDGLPVDMRRSDVLSIWLPIHINWLLNSLGDAGIVCLGGLWLMWISHDKDLSIFKEWRWDAFLVLLTWCIGQNLIVELFLYEDQLGVGKPISWAPFTPLGPYINPILFNYGDRTVALQSQVPWLIMTVFLYKLVIYLNNRDDKRRI